MGPYTINLLLKLHIGIVDISDIGIVDISETVLQLPLNSKLISLQNIYLPRVYNCHYRQSPDIYAAHLDNLFKQKSHTCTSEKNGIGIDESEYIYPI